MPVKKIIIKVYHKKNMNDKSNALHTVGESEIKNMYVKILNMHLLNTYHNYGVLSVCYRDLLKLCWEGALIKKKKKKFSQT